MNAKVMIDECGNGYREMRLRKIRKKAIEVFPKQPPGGDPPPPTLVPPGAIAVFVARSGSGVIDEVRAAAKEGGDRAEKLAARLASQLKKRPKLSVAAAGELMAKQPVFADLRYGGGTLCNGLFVPKGLDCAVVILPYNGGRLSAEDFQIAEYIREGPDVESLEAIAVVSQPPLTQAELAALRACPTDQFELNVGFASWCDTTAWAAAAVVAVAVLVAVALATAGCIAVAERHLTDAQIKKLGPAASARKLLDLRRTALRNLAGV